MNPNTGTMPRHGKPLMIQWGSKLFPIYDGVTDGPWEVSQYSKMSWHVDDRKPPVWIAKSKMAAESREDGRQANGSFE